MPDIIGRIQSVTLSGQVTSGQTFSDRLDKVVSEFDKLSAEVADTVNHQSETIEEVAEDIDGLRVELETGIVSRQIRESDYVLGYINTSGVLRTDIHGVYTPLLDGGWVIESDTTDIVFSKYWYNPDTGAFVGANVNGLASPQKASAGYKTRFMAFWRDTGVYGVISEARAKEILPHIKVSYEGKSNLLGTNPYIAAMEESIDRIATDSSERVDDLRDELLTGEIKVEPLPESEYTLGYLGTGSGNLQTKVVGVYTPLLPIGYTISVDTSEIGAARYRYNLNGEFVTGTYSSSRPLPETTDKDTELVRYLVYWKDTGATTVIAEDRARALIPHITVIKSDTESDLLGNNKHIGKIESDIETLKCGTALPTIPSHFQTEVTDTINKIVSAATEPCYAMIFVTDSHHSVHESGTDYENWDVTGKNIIYLSKKYPLDAIIHGGDLTTGNVGKARTIGYVDEVLSDLRAANDNVFCLIGNHDDNSYNKDNYTEDKVFHDGERYARYQRNTSTRVYSDGHESYYYDVDTLGLRVICLSAVRGEGVDSTEWGYTDAQVTWYSTVALNTTNHVAIFSHMPFTSALCQNSLQKGSTMRQATDAFINRGGVVVGLFHGHTHWDNMGSFSGSSLKEISTACSWFKLAETNKTVTIPSRTRNTVSEDLWDVIVIKPASRTVNMIRFGAGSDRSFTY